MDYDSLTYKQNKGHSVSHVINKSYMGFISIAPLFCATESYSVLFPKLPVSFLSSLFPSFMMLDDSMTNQGFEAVRGREFS